MPVLLDPGSQAIYTWLDPARTEWGPDLQRLLRPYKGDLDCYPVNHDVGKVGNNDPNFIVPLSSTQNKANIMNFFSKHTPDEKSTGIKQEVDNHSADRVQPDHRATEDVDRSEDNAPMPVSPPAPKVKREHPDDDMDLTTSKRQRSDQTSYGRPVRSGDRVDRNMRSSTHNISKKGGGANSKLSVSGKKNTKITSFFVDQAAG